MKSSSVATPPLIYMQIGQVNPLVKDLSVATMYTQFQPRLKICQWLLCVPQFQPTSWISRKQPTISRSSIEVDYCMVTNATIKIIWLGSLIIELSISITNPLVLWCNNVGATYLMANSIYHAFTKHIELEIHFVCDQVVKCLLHIRFIFVKDQVADSFTKALLIRFYYLRDNLNVHERPLQLGGIMDQQNINNQIKPKEIEINNHNNITTIVKIRSKRKYAT